MITEYTTQSGDTIFGISFKAYGTVYRYADLLTANPSLPITTVYPAGLKLIIPVNESAPETIATENLPPWKR